MIIATINPGALACGLTLPFYPMRPTHGAKATADQFRRDRQAGWLMQPKLNGDRATLGVTADGGVVVANRHMSLYKFNVLNKGTYAKLEAGTCLDGEVYQSNFYPFECLAVGARSALDMSVEDRVVMARMICELLGVEWKFEPLTTETQFQALLAFNAKLENPPWEGYVKKRRGSPYAILGVERESSDWFKVKWQ